MASRSKIRDALIRHLRDHNIPVQADREGGLMERPVVADLDGLIQLLLVQIVDSLLLGWHVLH